MDFNRYSRQYILKEVGEEGQKRLLSSRAVVVGLGALGGVTAEALARAGVGYLRVIDRDVVQESNLARQTLFNQKDADQRMSKALAAERYLKSVNPTIEINAINKELNASNCAELLDDVDIILDGTDNYPTRFLMNEFAIMNNLPWIYTAVLGVQGVSLAVLPGKGPCLTCLLEQAPLQDSFPTTEKEGVLGTTAGLAGSLQATRAIRYLVSGETDANLLSFNIWEGIFRSRVFPRWADCPTCALRKFLNLTG
jgi:molybdopterin/thiamine biosynthesis adenylyltransferase